MDGFLKGICHPLLRLSKNLLDHIPTTQLYSVRASLEFLDLTQMAAVEVVPNRAFHGLRGLRTLLINSMPILSKIEALGRGNANSTANDFVILRKLSFG